MRQSIIQLIINNQSQLHPGDVLTTLTNKGRIIEALRNLLEEGKIMVNEDGTLRTKAHRLYDETRNFTVVYD